MMKKSVLNIFAVFMAFVLLSLAALPVFGVDAGPLATADQVADKVENKEHKGMKYVKYQSPKAKAEPEGDKLVILYFGNAAAPEGRGMLNLFVSDYTDNYYKDYSYVVLAPNPLDGDSWVKDPGAFSMQGTESMDLVVDMLEEEYAISLMGADPKKLAVIGLGDGATAAFDFACRCNGAVNSFLQVSRVLTIGGTFDSVKLGQVGEGSKIAFSCFAASEDQALVGALSSMSAKFGADAIGKTGFVNIYIPGSQATLAEEMLKYAEPSVPEWAISEFYSAENFRYKITHTKKGEGGQIAVPGQIKPGDNARVSVTLDKGYKISHIVVDGKTLSVEALTPSTTNNLQYFYLFENVKSNHHIEVAFEEINSLGQSGGFIDKIVTVLTLLSIAAALLAAGVFAADRLVKRKNRA